MLALMKRIVLFAAMLLVAAGCVKDLGLSDLNDEIPVETIEETPDVTIIHAGFENADSPDTKTSLQLNGNVAKVLWTLGDQIRVYGISSQGGYYGPKVFTTQAGGSSSADFSCSTWNPNYDCVHYYAFYPSNSCLGYSIINGTPSFFVEIPSGQTAVPGGITEGLNISYASAATIAEDFTFRNIPALIKFSLVGDIVSSINNIKFISNDSKVAGGCILSDINTPSPSYLLDYNIEGIENATSTVTLNKPSGGSFSEDVDYYIAVYPGTTQGFSMVFINDEGEYVVKVSTKTLELARSQITDFGTINVGNSFGDPLVREYKARSSSSSFKPVDVVVIPDGFTEDQRVDFELLASEGIDFLFASEPYKSYEDYFNVYFIWAASKEEGGSVTDGDGHILDGGFHDTAFGSRWGEDDYDDMQADAEKVFGYVSAHCPEIVRGELTIDEVPVLLIVNDPRFGGRAITYSSGQTYCVVPYTYRGNEITWPYPGLMPDSVFNESINSSNPPCHDTNPSEYEAAGGEYLSGDWRNTLLHEFGGHSFGRLADEYWYNGWYQSQSEIEGHTYPVKFGMNITGIYGSYPWQELLDRRDALINQNSLYERIGVFQGADVSLFNRWRSEMVSCMINNRPYFSTWQRVLIAERIMDLAGGTFDLDAYLAADDPTDPSRDGSLGKRGVNSKGPLVIAPLLPPPILIDNTSNRTLIE